MPYHNSCRSGRVERCAGRHDLGKDFDTLGLPDAGLWIVLKVEEVGSGAKTRLGGGNPIAHHLTNVVITNEEHDVVTVQSKGLMIMANGTFGSVTHLDTLMRYNGRWRISRRMISASALH